MLGPYHGKLGVLKGQLGVPIWVPLALSMEREAEACLGVQAMSS